MWTLIESVVNFILNLLLPEIELDAQQHKRFTPFIKFSILSALVLIAITSIGIILYHAFISQIIIAIVIILNVLVIAFWLYIAYKNTQRRNKE